MLEHLISWILPEIISFLELIGIAVITFGATKAFYFYCKSFLVKKRYPIRIELANALALGLEFKMGAEILKTVLVRNFSEILILGSIILLRALLSIMIHFELKAEETHGSKDEASMNNY